MCGICGFFHKKQIEDKVLYDMNQTIHYRGPNDEGYYMKSLKNNFQIGLAQKRLSIIDLSPLGHQPMFSQDETIIVVYNGEIYNFQGIKDILLEKGYFFKSNTDTEVIIYAYQEWGIDCIHQFNGMFAIAIFDKRKDELYLIRDRMGVKPLYYYYNQQDIVFASELKPIMKYPFFHKEINMNALNMFLYHQYIVAPHTIFKNTYKLKPGCYLLYKNGQISEVEYWSVNDKFGNEKIKDWKGEKKYIQELDDLLTDSVKLRMISDVPVGGFLSGGIDSSLIMTLMQKVSSNPVQSFTIGFEEDNYNEALYARKVAKYLGTNHHETYLPVNKAKELIEKLPIFYDEPFADSSQLPTMLVSKIAKQNVTVSLSGDAGDELFCGYSRYDNILKFKKYKIFSKYLNGIDTVLPLKNFLVKSNFNRKYIKLFNLNSDEAIINSDYLTFKDKYKNITSSPFNLESKYFNILDLSDNIQQKHMLQDLITYLPDDILTKVDRASMSATLEARTPFLDYRVVEYALNMPHNMKYKNGCKKYILKELLYRYIPKELVDRPKMGFGVPIYKWLHDDFKRYGKNYFDRDFIKEQGIFNYQEIDKIVNQFNNKQNPNVDKLMWTLIVFQMWYDEYM
ncbi:asparagine synthase (glutamine-hydrolyzing) [Marinisporobacter balticus]|uniref:asparagine synthase (glutamine-hydrolyzing) n=1 Tax=Marinisporobacter balticus TaxID=2018667 RepID=A0A4V2SCD3_9FIRM|nr:asparagine synthase (glutamine-hydrolyzing) [Marinisporobacter balticus]TCO78830.1 asparagine synthase (glutamine-hydrolysing) [Marinisporobacter balticus]